MTPNRKKHSKAKTGNESARILLKVLIAMLCLGVLGLGALAAGVKFGSKSTKTNTGISLQTTTTQGPAIFPLTGLLSNNPSLSSRPAIDVKIDDDYAARPQSGINQADLVYEEVVEGGITRWLAVFQSQDAPVLGPVRSVRETDAQLVAPIGGLFAYSGGIPPFISDVMATGVVDVGASTGDPSAYYRDNARLIPDNLYTSTLTLRKFRTSYNSPPPKLFDYRAIGAPFVAFGALPVSSISVPLSGVSNISWNWNPTTNNWDRIQGVPARDAQGNPITATNVIVEIVPYSNTGYIDPAGNPVPDANTVGTGRAYVLSGGRVAKAIWTKPFEKSITVFTDMRGHKIDLEPGNTWVELLPESQPNPTCTSPTGVTLPSC